MQAVWRRCSRCQIGGACLKPAVTFCRLGCGRRDNRRPRGQVSEKEKQERWVPIQERDPLVLSAWSR
jgi:hypothetical protein